MKARVCGSASKFAFYRLIEGYIFEPRMSFGLSFVIILKYMIIALSDGVDPDPVQRICPGADVCVKRTVILRKFVPQK